MELLRIEDLTFTYPQRKHPSLQNIHLQIQKGEFIALCGSTGSGKSTLLKMIKKQIAPQGTRNGAIFFQDTSLDELSEKDSACKIGFVMQNPELQIVTDKVWHELAFGLENMGVPQNEMARRVAEMSYYFGIEDWFDKNTSELSGGQKQLLNLASIMVMNPDLLILDEPTSQLDPIAASEFIATLKKLNSDMALTILVVEHRLEELFPVCDRLIVMDNGHIEFDDKVQNVVAQITKEHPMFDAMPSASRVFTKLDAKGNCPLSVKEGREFIERNYKNDLRALEITTKKYTTSKAIVDFNGVFFRYGRTQKDVLSDLHFQAYENEIVCILGGNGSGKSTFLHVLAGISKPYAGKVALFDKKLSDYKNQSLYRNCISLLPQDVQTVFLKNTVREELEEINFDDVDFPFDISYLYDQHPYDISGGEQQLVALAKVLATKPKVLLMDEPTKGVDAQKKNEICAIVKKLKANGVTVIIVTHDVEFAAVCADRCALFFKGNIISDGEPCNFFSENSFYTTAISRMTKGYFDHTVLVDSLVELCKRNGEKQ